MRDAELSEIRREIAVLLRRQAETGLSVGERVSLDLLETRLNVLERIEAERLAGYAPIGAAA